MFCKNCGAKLDDDAQFCSSCGQKTSENNYTAPKPFEKNSVDESQNYQYQKSTFTGKQFSTGTSGSVSFGSQKKKKSLLSRVIGVVVFIIVASFIYGIFFSDNGPIYNVHTASSIDSETLEPLVETNTFSTSTTEVFITFSTRDFELGTVIQADWYYVDLETYIDSSVLNIVYDEQDNYVSLVRPNDGWPVGEYQVDFFAGDDYIVSVFFTIE